MLEPILGLLKANVLQTDKRDRHLLPFIRRRNGKAAHFLRGHDEREWYVAAVPRGASSVMQAEEALKPVTIRTRQNQFKGPTRLRTAAKTRRFVVTVTGSLCRLRLWDAIQSTRRSFSTMNSCDSVRCCLDNTKIQRKIFGWTAGVAGAC